MKKITDADEILVSRGTNWRCICRTIRITNNIINMARSELIYATDKHKHSKICTAVVATLLYIWNAPTVLPFYESLNDHITTVLGWVAVTPNTHTDTTISKHRTERILARIHARQIYFFSGLSSIPSNDGLPHFVHPFRLRLCAAICRYCGRRSRSLGGRSIAKQLHTFCMHGRCTAPCKIWNYLLAYYINMVRSVMPYLQSLDLAGWQ